jgi:hypothetical protein
MADPLTQSVSWSVIDGIGLLLGPLRKAISKSGLSVAFQSGRVGAIGLDFYSQLKQESYEYYVPWTFAIKLVNPNSYAIALESVSADWWTPKGRFFATTSKYNTGLIRPIYPKATLPEDGDESLPRLIPAGATELLEVSCMLELYQTKFWFLKQRKTTYTKAEYGAEPPDLRFEVRVRTNRGVTKLKSS